MILKDVKSGKQGTYAEGHIGCVPTTAGTLLVMINWSHMVSPPMAAQMDGAGKLFSFVLEESITTQ
jgi:hypothetical protein